MTGRKKQYVKFENSSRLMFITHRTAQYTELDEIKMITEGGCDWVQLRMKDNPSLEIAKAVSHYLSFECKTPCVCCLDDQLEMAFEANISCVHLGKKDIPVSEAWKRITEKGLDEQFMIGATANTFEDIINAVQQGANYIGLGPYRFTETKKNLSPVLGLEGYRTIVQQCQEADIQIPIFAIGGIEFEDIAPLMATGITGIAVSGSLIRAADPIAETRRYVEEIRRCMTK